MDKFSVTGSKLREFYSTETKLADVFRDIERELANSEMVVCQYIVNGLALSETDEYKYSEVKLIEVESFEYLVEKTGNLVHKVVGGWLDGLPELIHASEKYSDEVRSGFSKISLKKIYDLVENCQYLINSIDSIRALLGDQASGIIIPWEQTLNNLKMACFESLRCVEQKNNKALADTLEYDLPHNLQILLNHLDKFDAFLFGEQKIENAGRTNKIQQNSTLDRRKSYN